MLRRLEASRIFFLDGFLDAALSQLAAMVLFLSAISMRSLRTLGSAPRLPLLLTASRAASSSTASNDPDPTPFVRESAPHTPATLPAKVGPRSNYSGRAGQGSTDGEGGQGQEGGKTPVIDYRARTEAARNAGPSGPPRRFGNSGSSRVEGFGGGRADSDSRRGSSSSEQNRYTSGRSESR